MTSPIYVSRRQEVIEETRRLSAETGRKYVCRYTGSEYIICPYYELGHEGNPYRVDHGYAGLGLLVSESPPNA